MDNNSNSKKKVALHNLGCKVNAYETEAMTELLIKAGYDIVPFEEGADIYIINTCTVTNIADRKSRQMLHKAKKMNPKGKVIAAGCYAQAAAKDIEKDSAIDIVVGNDMKRNIVEIIESDGKMETLVDINDAKVKREFEELNIEESMEERARAYIKIQDGCNQFCSYCIIPFARGRVRCRKPENIRKEVKRLADRGYKELVLTGIHISSYTYEENGINYTLKDIVKLISMEPRIKRIRLGSLEPRIITEDFMETIAGIESMCPHFHLSLQSGCDTVLKRMNRRYNTVEFYNGVELIRKYYPEAAITTDVIVGFVGETEEEHKITHDFLEKVHFSQMHIFKYSMRKGTRAAHMDNQVDPQVKNIRSEDLLSLDAIMHKEFLDGQIGKCKEVLFEEEMSIDNKRYFVGHTREYVKVAVETDDNLSNEIINVKITDYVTDEIMLAMF